MKTKAQRVPKPKPETSKPRKVRKKAVPSKAFSSRVSSGKALFPHGVDGRSEFSRLVRDRFLTIIADQGGIDNVSTLGQTIVRRVAVIDAICVDREAKLALGERVDIAEYLSLCNAFNRLGNTIGLARKQIDVTPSLSEYLASKAAGSSRTGEEPDGDE